jgi:hypothetical protein
LIKIFISKTALLYEKQTDKHAHNPQLNPAAVTFPNASNKTFSRATDERWFAEAKFVYKGFPHRN